jgi:uncharacterized protein (TIGR02453 family)
MGIGIPAEAFDFYDRLAADNTREFWNGHKGEYEQYVREPLQGLADALEPEFGEPHMYRPYRDMRFSKDKTPIKDHQGCLFTYENGLGWYMQVSGAGLMVAGGWYMSTPSQVKRYREHVVEFGAPDLRAAMAKLGTSGFEVSGDQLKTRPRGVAEDHPDLDLLRYRTMHATKVFEPEAWMGTGRVQTTVRTSFDTMRPFLEALSGLVGPPE